MALLNLIPVPKARMTSSLISGWANSELNTICFDILVMILQLPADVIQALKIKISTTKKYF